MEYVYTGICLVSETPEEDGKRDTPEATVPGLVSGVRLAYTVPAPQQVSTRMESACHHGKRLICDQCDVVGACQGGVPRGLHTNYTVQKLFLFKATHSC